MKITTHHAPTHGRARAGAVQARALLTLVTTLVVMSACAAKPKDNQADPEETNPRCTNGARDGDETGIDCGGSCVSACGPDGRRPNRGSNLTTRDNGAKDGDESDVDCGGSSGRRCAEGRRCASDADCEVACSYANVCVGAPSCKAHLGGDTCGYGEVGQGDERHESCCRTLEVTGYEDPAHPGKRVYLDKYEITAGRVRAFIEQLAAERGAPDVKGWIREHRPDIWDEDWDEFLPTDYEGGTMTIGRRLLGDPRVEDGTGDMGPGVILPPATDEVRRMGVNYQFGSEIYVDLHGNNCGTFAGSYGFPTFYYPADILARDQQVPRADGKDYSGKVIAAKDLLDVKAMNCITNAMLAAFCAWDGGQLATDEALDYVTGTPESLGLTSGCGTQHDSHGDLLGNDLSTTVQSGGRCASVSLVNATFDAGDTLPVDNSPLNAHNYIYPDLGDVTHDKAWEVAAPGRASLANDEQTDVVRLADGAEPWMDLNGNLNEAAFDTEGGEFTGNFALKYRGIAYGSSRSDLNMERIAGEGVLRLQRPEAKAAYSGGRCMRFR